MRIGIYPGSFDPITNGHIDIVQRSLALFDRVIVAVAVNSKKSSLFSVEERLTLLREILGAYPKVEVDTFSDLLVDFAERKKACAVIRGIRAVTDFDYEYAMYQMNHDLNEKVDTVFLLAAREYSFLSSTILKEVCRYGRSVPTLAPVAVNQALLKKFGHIT